MLRLSPKERKRRMFEEFRQLISGHRYIIFVDAYRLRASMLQEVRRLQDELGFRIKGGKKTVFFKALETIYPDLARRIVDDLKGQVLFIFTNKNPIEIAMTLDKFEVDLPASPGDIAPVDIVIPEGNTGIPPGPIISLFSNFGIPTKIIGGAINVMKDTVVARAGDKISANLANLLSKLGIKPIKSKMVMRFAVDLEEGVIIRKEHLLPDIEAIKEDLSRCFEHAFKVAIELGYPTAYTVRPLLVRAFMNNRAISLELGIPTRHTIKELIARAYRVARLIEERTAS